MAGSYNHCIDDQGRLLEPEALCSMLECMSGDVYEAVEEMYGMIWLLADRYAMSNTTDVYDDVRTLGEDTEITSAAVVKWAQERYQEGLALSPGLLAGETVTEIVRRQMRG